MTRTDLYAGTWDLIPELSIYEFGSPPTEGGYRIDLEDARVRITIEWRTGANGTLQSTGFGGPIDGSLQPLNAAAPAAGPDSFSLTRIDRRTLDSAAFRAGEMIAYARRAASADGELLAVVQQALDPEGGRYRNFQVYRRRR